MRRAETLRADAQELERIHDLLAARIELLRRRWAKVPVMRFRLDKLRHARELLRGSVWGAEAQALIVEKGGAA